MSLQLQNLHPQPKQTHIHDHTGGDPTNDVLVSSLLPITLDLFNTKQSSTLGGFFNSKRKQKRTLDDHYRETMSKRGGNNNPNDIPKLDLKLNLSPPRAHNHDHDHDHDQRVESPSWSISVTPPSSCVSSESNGSETITSMVLVGCPRCLMYVMLSEEDPKCPKCKSNVLLDFLHDNNNNYFNISGCSKKTRKILS